MNNRTSSPDFEEHIRQSFGVPAIRSEFVDQVYGALMQRAEIKTRLPRPYFRMRRAWTVALTILSLIIISTLLIGPQRVFAAIGRLFGYIPGVGIVDDSAPIRVLAEPVSITRVGISITVTSATLTGDSTHIDYRIFGVPGSAYPDREDVMGCTQREYLRLKDATILDQVNNGYQPVPVGVNEAVFVIPCIGNTLPGKVPENWELPLRFVPAPPELTVMPVIDITPIIMETPIQSTLVEISVEKEIETGDGYILIGRVHPQVSDDLTIAITGIPIIHDASGNKVVYTFPQDIDATQILDLGNDEFGFSFQIKAAGVTFPLTIDLPGKIITPAIPNATAEIDFDAGSNPQTGQEWTLNKQIELAGHTLKLISITADSQNGYGFQFETGKDIAGLSVQIDGYAPIGGGGGGDNQGMINQSISFADLPKGNLKIIFSHLMLASETQFWQSQWSPSTIRTDLPANPTAQPGVCLTADSLERLNPAPVDLAIGTALIYEQIEDTDQWGLVLYYLDGSVKEVFTSNAIRGSLSPDGSQMAYPAEDGLHILDLISKTEKVLTGTSGFNLHWSPDGKQIAYIGMGDGIVNSVFVINTDGTLAHRISDWSYETVIGWSPDGTQLYFTAPYTGGAAWKVYSYDFASSAVQERFTIENGTPKFLNPKLSPDGNWISYRGRDNSSLYLVHPDGSGMHLVLDNVGAVGIEWSRSGWLGVSVRNTNTDVSTVILIKPNGCEAYRLPSTLHGDLEGLFIP